MTTTVSIDPRINARREEVAADNSRRRGLKFGAFLVVVLLGVAAAVSTRTALLDVDAIDVTGIENTTAADVVMASGITKGDPLTGLDLAAAREAIAALPWVDEVVSRQTLDGSVNFAITERVPVAQTVSPDGASVSVVDEEGRILEVLDSPRSDMVTVYGASGAGEAGGWVASTALDGINVASRLPVGLADRVSEVRVSDVGSIELELTDVGVAVLGDSVDLDLKLISLHTMIDQVDLTCMEVLDLQVPTVPVLTRSSSC